MRKGVNGAGHPLAFLLNYTKDEVELTLPVAGTDVLGTTGQAGAALAVGQDVTLPGWGVLVLEDARA